VTVVCVPVHLSRHVQHEMIVAEQKILGRDGNTFTSVVGYAGGTQVGKDSKVCYHNMKFDSDYGEMGHTEVVAVKVPNDRLLYFIEAFLRLFNDNGIRADPQDQGGEYRTALGLPGGMDNDAVPVLKYFAEEKGMKVVAGKGNEKDTLKDKIIYVYNTSEFPFYAGELYHQYHDDMVERYGEEYAKLRDVAQQRGTLSLSRCPGDQPFLASNAAPSPPVAQKPKISFE
jgi:peptide methionine sulfoxide reductase MsrA